MEALKSGKIVVRRSCTASYGATHLTKFALCKVPGLETLKDFWTYWDIRENLCLLTDFDKERIFGDEEEESEHI